MFFALHLVLGAQGCPTCLWREALHHNSARFFCAPRYPIKLFPSCWIHADPSEVFVLLGDDPTLPVTPQIWGFLPPSHKVIGCPGPTAVLADHRAGL